MKNLFLLAFMTILSIGVVKAQNGLEDVAVETFYISDANDAASGDPGTDVPLGSTTYRVYVDLAAGWELVSIYGQTDVAAGKVDNLAVQTTTTFFNNEDRGATFGYDIGTNRLDDNTVMIDSYWSTGRTSGGTEGVFKTEDTDGAIANSDGLLQNADGAAGIAISIQDGNIPSTSTVTFTPTPGFDTQLATSFGDTNAGGNGISTSDAALGLTVSLVGPTADNRVLMGQFTTDGIFTFNLNLLLRETATGATEEWVWETPQAGQFTMAALAFGPNDAPTVNITAPANGASYTAGQTVSATATAADTDGTIAQVEFFFEGVSVGVDTDGTDGYAADFSATASGAITAVATDDDGDTTTSAAVNITVAGNDAPTVSMTAPLTAITGDMVAISANAVDNDGTVAQVEFFVDGVSIGVDTDGTDGYNASWTAVVGSHVLSATATDDIGATGSATQNILVNDNQVPTVAITDPSENDNVNEGNVTVTATATDNDGTVAQVEFFVDGISIGVDTDGTDGFSADWNAVYNAGNLGNAVITATATDDRADTGDATPVNVRVLNPNGAPYAVTNVEQFCNETTVCMPIAATTAIADVIGFDIVVAFDNDKIYPTGTIVKSSDLVDAALFDTDYSIDFNAEQMLITVYFQTTAPIGSSFDGIGDIICVEFAKRPGFSSTDNSTVEVTSLQESYVNGVVPYADNIPSGVFNSIPDTLFTGELVFWADDSPIAYDPINPTDYLITNISGTDGNCDNVSSTSVQTNVAGSFVHNLNNGLSIQIDRDIAGTTSVQPVVNGFDVLQVRRLLINDLSAPSIYQIIAMDVNLDGVISAGDASQMNQRAVLILDEFRQAWNYNIDGTPIPGAGDSKDWMFVENSSLNVDPAFAVSASFPSDDGVGFSKSRVPVLPFCAPTPVTDFNTCPEIETETYKGILLGDINGNYMDIMNDGLLRSDEQVIVDLVDARFMDGYVQIPVTFESGQSVNTIDLAFNFDLDKLTYHSIQSEVDELQVLGHFNENDNKLRITSNSLNVLQEDQNIFHIQFEMDELELATEDFNAAEGYINGDPVDVEFLETTSIAELNPFKLEVFPNPTEGLLTVNVAADAKFELVDVHGRILIFMDNVMANSTTNLDLSKLANGMYILNVYNEDHVISEKIVVGK